MSIYRTKEINDEDPSGPSKAYRNVIKHLESRYFELTKSSLEVKKTTSPRKDFERIVEIIIEEITKRGIDPLELVDQDFYENTAGAESKILETRVGSLPQVFSLDDFPANEVKKFIVNEIETHLSEADTQPMELAPLFSKTLIHFSRKAKTTRTPRSGNNRHSFPLFRWLRELEFSPIKGTSIYFYISRPTGGIVSEFPEGPGNLILRFYEG